MLKSMTGYGKAELLLGQDKYLVEIRSVNGKNADITFKTSLIPREKEVEVRQYIANSLCRGNIDLFISVERGAGQVARTLNPAAVAEYERQIREAGTATGVCFDEDRLMEMILRLPDVFETKSTELDEDEWNALYEAIKKAVAGLDGFRIREGESLRRDVLGQVSKIESYVSEVERYEKERIDAVRERILARMAELPYLAA